jgi:DnaK suppressor protein
VENYRQILLALKQSLLKAQETGDQAEQTVELDQTRMGRLSRMDAMQVQAMSKETGRRRRQKLLQIDAALRRLEEDDYGYCQDCGEDIAPARLEVDPTVLLCITCASAKELL